MTPTNLIPFDLEKAKRGEKVVTNGGLEYKFGAHNPNSQYQKVVGWVVEDGMEKLFSHNEDGIQDNYPNGYYDLFMAPVKRQVWVAVFKNADNDEIKISALYPSKKDADDFGVSWTSGFT